MFWGVGFGSRNLERSLGSPKRRCDNSKAIFRPVRKITKKTAINIVMSVRHDPWAMQVQL